MTKTVSTSRTISLLWMLASYVLAAGAVVAATRASPAAAAALGGTAAAPAPAAPAPAAATNPPAAAPPAWTEGKHYFLIQSLRPPAVPPGKVEVTEVFSYACPACNAFLPTMHKLQKSLPPYAVLDYVPAAFNPAEDWPMFQLAYCTAQALGVAEKTHDAMFAAVWTSGELAVADTATGRLKEHMPTIEDAARFYEKHAGIPVATFLGSNSGAKSFTVSNKVLLAEQLVRIYGVDSTPTIVVNGKYRVQVQSAGGPDQLVELVDWLVAKENKAAPKEANAAKAASTR